MEVEETEVMEVGMEKEEMEVVVSGAAGLQSPCMLTVSHPPQ